MAKDRLIETQAFARAMRAKIIRPDAGELLVSRFMGSDQEADLTAPPNSGGLGRVRHFRRHLATGDWPANPLPLDPACKALGLPPAEVMTAQLFQNAACAWRCWYCYVPFNMLNGDAARGAWVTAPELVDLYRKESIRAQIIDLSGGSPDLTPEWVAWMMDALEESGFAETTFLWSDDNLSTDYVFSILNESQRRRLTTYRNYARVCCFKGFDEGSFVFNTQAAASAFDAQFEIFARYLELGLDLYGYVTLTGPDVATVAAGVPKMMDRLQRCDEALPLRVVPLRIDDYTPTKERVARRTDTRHAAARAVQAAAINLWRQELDRRFSASDVAKPITEVPIGRMP
jgi:uncharacterized Fe-S cluster-containing radical SAM superfamily protein